MTLTEIQENKASLFKEADEKAKKFLAEMEMMQSIFKDYQPPFTITKLEQAAKTHIRLPHGRLESIIFGLLSTDINQRKFRKDFVALAKQHEGEGVKINSIEQAVERLIVAGKIKENVYDKDGGKRSFIKI